MLVILLVQKPSLPIENNLLQTSPLTFFIYSIAQIKASPPNDPETNQKKKKTDPYNVKYIPLLKNPIVKVRWGKPMYNINLKQERVQGFE
ncbi:hypothetical protein Bca4012_046282 [Brassica carinata]